MELHFTFDSVSHFGFMLNRAIQKSESKNLHIKSSEQLAPSLLSKAKSLKEKIDIETKDICSKEDSNSIIFSVHEDDLEFINILLDEIFELDNRNTSFMSKSTAKQLNRLYERINDGQYNESFLLNYRGYS